MSSELIVAVLSCIGTVAGSITGILVSNKLSNYRIEQLEKKIDKYATSQDDLKERLVIVEQRTKSAHKRIDDITAQLKLKDNRRDE